MRVRLRKATTLLVSLAGALLLAGCPPKCPETLLPLEEVIEQYNTNVAKVPQLWARVKLAIAFAGEPLTWGSMLLPPNGLLLAARGPNRLGPHYVVLIGKEAGQQVFRLGSSPEESFPPGGADKGIYYIWYRWGRRAGAWVGQHKYAGAPGIKELPINPNQLLAVLGIFEMPKDFTKLPTLALSMSTDPCAYVVTCIDRQPVTNRLLFQREVYFRWSDTEPPRPFRINLFAADGRRIMTAELKDYRTIDTADGSDPRPVMPTDIHIEWVRWPGDPMQIRSIDLRLSEMTTDAAKASHKEACRFADGLPTGLPVVLVDEDLSTGGQRQ